ncbi:hypothetical protein O181_068168 [Austropuccinia psidii MF-1]|uniref:Uncharacterized protein n=1 Tax=Austropuccinia psidii MF-1 TaxID=1389203 RepID=A0A9Q3EUS2_9BASI|nr:hypothetical protein [Austropuccinia psidii MF-1]
MSYSEKEALKQLPEASRWPKFSVVGEYDHMELIDYIDGLLIDVPSIPDYWITTRLNTALKVHASIRYNTHSTGDNRENPTLEAKETHDSESEITIEFDNCESPNHYADNFPKNREEILEREKETRKDQEGHESDSDSVSDGCGNDSYSEPNPNEEYLVEFKSHGTKEIGSVHLKRRKPMTKHLDGLKHKPPDREDMTTIKLLAQGHMSHTSNLKKTGKSHQL